MSYKIIPNLLPEIQFKGLQHYIMSNNFSWFFPGSSKPIVDTRAVLIRLVCVVITGCVF